MAFPKASTALERFTVLDLTRVRAGPTAARQLADWGANVIKLELPEAAAIGEDPGGPRHGSDFQNLHRGKRSITLDFKHPVARSAFYRMVEKADVVIENFRPAVKHRLKIDYETLRAFNRGLVYASVSGFGQSGPYRDRPGFDQVAQGMGGLMSITGLPGQGPVRAGIPVADLSAGLFCAMGILIALLDFQAARWLNSNEVPRQAGNNHPTTIPTGVFKTRDGYINIATTGGRIWERFCQAIGASELASDQAYATSELRSRNREALNAAIQARLSQQTSAQWVERLNAAGVPCGPIYSVDETFSDPQVQHLGMVQSIDTAEGKSLHLLGQPVSLSRTPSRIAAPPPERGQHTDDVLHDFGFSAAEVAELRRLGAI